jgi:hypothetical protein
LTRKTTSATLSRGKFPLGNRGPCLLIFSRRTEDFLKSSPTLRWRPFRNFPLPRRERARVRVKKVWRTVPLTSILSRGGERKSRVYAFSQGGTEGDYSYLHEFWRLKCRMSMFRKSRSN